MQEERNERSWKSSQAGPIKALADAFHSVPTDRGIKLSPRFRGRAGPCAGPGTILAGGWRWGYAGSADRPVVAKTQRWKGNGSRSATEDGRWPADRSKTCCGVPKNARPGKHLQGGPGALTPHPSDEEMGAAPSRLAAVAAKMLPARCLSPFLQLHLSLRPSRATLLPDLRSPSSAIAGSSKRPHGG